jgi:integrase
VENRTVELERWVYDLLLARRDLGIYMLSGDEDERTSHATDRVIEWLRAHGLADIDKPLHELRKWFGSFVAQTFGLTEAQRRLGHSTPQLTCDYYADLEFPAWLADLWRKAPTAAP